MKTKLLLVVGSIIGLFVGIEAGLSIEHGFGMLTIVAAAAGVAAGVYVAQLIVLAPTDESD